MNGKPTEAKALDALTRLWHEFSFGEHCQLVDNLDKDAPEWRKPRRELIIPEGVQKTRRKLMAVSIARDVLREAGRI